MQVAVLNGVNLNMLGRRDPEQYGTMTLSQVETKIYSWASELALNARCFQTNHEGAFVDMIHDACDWAGGLIVNPGAWTHYSYAVRDALEVFREPIVEVHLTAVETREEWRRISVVADVVTHRITGQGADGYRHALEYLKDRGQ
jgi:3-dehydroquinate dehydratase II